MVGRSRRSVVAVLGALPLLAAAFIFGGAASSGAVTDTNAPVLASLSLTPNSLDTSTGPVTVSVVARITDETSPSTGGLIPLSNLVLTGPGGQQHVTVYLSQAQRIAGSATDGTYQATATLHWHAEPGRWTASATLVDIVGNTRTMTSTDLGAAGLPTGIDQTGAGDVTPPQLVSLQLSPPTVDTSLDTAVVVVTARVTDDLAGVASGIGGPASQVVLRGPTGAHHARASLDARRRGSGDALDGTYTVPVTLNRWSEQGVWTVESVDLVDDVGNVASVAAPGPSFTQTGVGDTLAPSFRSFSLSTDTVDVHTGASVLGVNTRIVDDRSGAAEGVTDSPSSITFASPSGRQQVRGLLGLAQRTSGTGLDGNYHVTLSIPAHAEPGAWTLRAAVGIDRAFNIASIGYADWSAKGFAGSFTVVSDAPPDTGPTVPTGPTLPPTTAPVGGESTSTSTSSQSSSTSSSTTATTSSPSSFTTTTTTDPAATTTTDASATTSTSEPATTTTIDLAPSSTSTSTTGSMSTSTTTRTGSSTTTTTTPVGTTGSPVPAADGYWFATASGRVAGYGGARTTGVSSAGFPTPAHVIGLARTRTGKGYVLATATGDVRAYGDAHTYGSLKGKKLPSPIAAIAITKSGKGYWLAARNGTMYHFGDAKHFGSPHRLRLKSPIVGVATSRSGNGYRLVASDGGVFAYGDATFYGSMGGKHLHRPVVGIAPTPTGKGYWLAGADGAVFAYGDAHSYGSASGKHLHTPVVGIAMTPSAHGYWLVCADGVLYRFGDAPSFGRWRGSTSVVGMAVHTS